MAMERDAAAQNDALIMLLDALIANFDYTCPRRSPDGYGGNASTLEKLKDARALLGQDTAT